MVGVSEFFYYFMDWVCYAPEKNLTKMLKKSCETGKCPHFKLFSDFYSVRGMDGNNNLPSGDVKTPGSWQSKL